MAGQIQPLDIVAPGAFGLNTEKAGVLLKPQWATTASNAVINRSGRIAARKGWEDQTTNPIASTPTIDVIHEYINKTGTQVIISAAANKIYKDVDDFTDANNNIVSTTAPGADHWQFLNFNNKVLGFQRGEVPIEWSGSSVFTDASYTGTGPDGNCAAVGFGRVWAADADLQSLRYSVLLDDTDYSTANGGGTIDMSSVWTNGMDQIVAIACVGGTLVVFGKNHIVLWSDGSGSEIGLDPTQMHVVDTIEGTGCIARDSIQVTGEGDIIFLSRHGLQSLGRVIQSKSNPTVTLTKNVRSDMLAAIVSQRGSDAQFDQVRSAHSPEEGFYVINFPAVGKQFVLDTQHPFTDDEGQEVFPVSTWALGGGIAAVAVTEGGLIYFGSAGVVGKYAGLSDNAVAYDFTFETGWLDFEQLNHRIKIMKELLASVVIGNGTVTYTWEFDFSGTQLTRQAVYSGQSVSEFNIAEFNIGEFAGGSVVIRRAIPMHGEGQFLKLGVTATINEVDLVVQHMSVAPKIGRLVT